MAQHVFKICYGYVLWRFFGRWEKIRILWQIFSKICKTCREYQKTRIWSKCGIFPPGMVRRRNAYRLAGKWRMQYRAYITGIFCFRRSSRGNEFQCNAQRLRKVIWQWCENIQTSVTTFLGVCKKSRVHQGICARDTWKRRSIHAWRCMGLYGDDNFKLQRP